MHMYYSLMLGERTLCSYPNDEKIAYRVFDEIVASLVYEQLRDATDVMSGIRTLDEKAERSFIINTKAAMQLVKMGRGSHDLDAILCIRELLGIASAILAE